MSINGADIRKSMEFSKKEVRKPNPFKYDVLYTPEGQWKYPGQVTKIPSGDITMRGVAYPVLGVDDLGNKQMMLPGQHYSFPGQTVTEYPQMNFGGDPSIPYINHQYQNGGNWGTPEQMYNDSLNLYKAYQFQKSNAKPGYEAWLKDFGSMYPGGPEELRKAREKNIGKFGAKFYDKESKKNFYNEPNHMYDPANKEEQPIIDYYNKLKFTGPTKIGKHSSPDLWHKYIDPIGRHYDGSMSPIYKKPVHNPSQKSKEQLETVPQEIVQYLENKPVVLPKQEEPELILPKQKTVVDTTGKRIAWRKDPSTKKMVPVITGINEPVAQGKRLYNKDIPSSTGAIPEDFVPQYENTSFEEGGWLDEFKVGGTPSSLAGFKAKRGRTSKNIQSSINKLFLRNHTLFGFSGKNIYDHRVKFESGGNWLDNLPEI